MKIILITVFSIVIFSCRHDKPDIETARNEIIQAEENFEKLAAEKGLAEAFSTYIAEDGVIRIGDSLVKGKAGARKHYENLPYKDVSLEWTPEFVDVATSGEMGYTYGPYTFKAIDSAGKEIVSRGYFHTVWKKQQDGSWRFVWD